MSATRLLVLGVVRLHGRAHGYLVGSELESWEAGQWAGLRSGSIYHALRQLAKEGL
ncbi:MAG: PadR family transcriptional regulator, partial [Nonomuraea sp.]|nr:PadR family transcriptional regulator [Nonomuraea sp.]